LCTTASPGAGVAGEAISKPGEPGANAPPGAALVHDMDDRDLQRAGTREQFADLGERSLDSDQRQLAVDIFALRVDDDDGRVRERRRRRREAGHFEHRFRFHACWFTPKRRTPGRCPSRCSF